MAEQAQTTSPETSEASQITGKAVEDAMASGSQGTSETIPANRNFVSRAIYSTSYAVSYGVVFPTMLIVRAMPKDNALYHGLVDGAEAARKRVFG